MGRESYIFDGLDEIEIRIQRLCDDISYMTLADRTDRSGEEQLGRFDFTDKDALPYLEQGKERPPSETLDQAFEEDEELALDTLEQEDEEEDHDEEEEEPAASDGASKRQRTPADYAQAACLWLRDIAQRNTVGEPYRRFRLRVYGPKGLRVVDTATFVCKNNDYDLDLPVPTHPDAQLEKLELRIPTPTFDEAAQQGAAKGFKVLGDCYSQWGQIVIGSVGQLQGINNALQARMHQQLQESRDQVDKLVASILEFRVAELKLDEQRRADERADDTRVEVAKHALQQLGEAIKAFLATRDVSPELADVLGAIGQSPALVAALNEPEVRELISEPQNLELLAGMLRQAGQQARLLKGASQTPNR